MNAPTFDLQSCFPIEVFASATERVNAWRGRCIDTFTHVEAAATECLAAMAGVEERGRRVTLPHLFGQRLDALAVAIAPGGPFAEEGGAILPTLERLREHAAFRNMLCHGTAKVTLDPKGRWTVVLHLVTLRSRQVVRQKLALTEAEAEELRDTVTRASQILSSRLGQLRANLR